MGDTQLLGQKTPSQKQQRERRQDWLLSDQAKNDGKTSGQFTGHNILLLHTIGAKSHQPRVNPVGYMKDGDAFVIIASKGGAQTNPD